MNRIASASIAANSADLSISGVTIDSTGIIVSVLVAGGQDGFDYVLANQITPEAGLVAVSEQVMLCRAAAR